MSNNHCYSIKLFVNKVLGIYHSILSKVILQYNDTKGYRTKRYEVLCIVMTDQEKTDIVSKFTIHKPSQLNMLYTHGFDFVVVEAIACTILASGNWYSSPFRYLST